MSIKLKHIGYALSAVGIIAAGFHSTSVFADSASCSAEPTTDTCTAADIVDLTAGINNNSIKTITLSDDIVTDVEISINHDLTLDLDEHTISASTKNHTIKVYTGAKLTINNGNVIGNKNSVSALFNNGEVEANGVNFTIDESGKPFYVITNHGKMVLNDCSAKRTTAGGASVVENGYSNYTSTNDLNGYKVGVNAQYPSLTINGGDYTVISGGGVEVIKTDDGAETTINDGIFSSDENTTGWLLQLSGRFLEINGGVFTSKDATIGDVLVYYCNGAQDEVNTCKLRINGGTFNAPQKTVDSLSASDLSNATITISGGAFKAEPVAAYIAKGKSAHKIGDKYVVTGDVEAETDKEDEIEKASDQTKIEDFVTSEIKDIIDGKYEERDGTIDTGKMRVNAERLQGAIANGKTILISYTTTEKDADEYLKSDVSGGVYKDIQDKLGDAKIAGAFDGTIGIFIDGDEEQLGEVYQLDDGVTISYDLPKAAQTVPTGYTRSYFFIRIHNGEVTKIPATRKGDSIEAGNDGFSVFLVAYEDTAIEEIEEIATNPKTLDKGGIVFATVAGASIPLILWGAYLATKRI